MSVDRVDLDLNIFSSCPGLCMLKLQLAVHNNSSTSNIQVITIFTIITYSIVVVGVKSMSIYLPRQHSF